MLFNLLERINVKARLIDWLSGGTPPDMDDMVIDISASQAHDVRFTSIKVGLQFTNYLKKIYTLLFPVFFWVTALSQICSCNCVVDLVKVYFTQRTTQRCCLLSALLPGSVATWFNYFQSGRMFISLPFPLNDCPLFIRKPIQFHPQPQLKKTNQKKKKQQYV